MNSCSKYTYFKYTWGKKKPGTQETVLATLTLNPVHNFPSVSQTERKAATFFWGPFQGLIFHTTAAQQVAETQVWLFGAGLGQFFTCLYFDLSFKAIFSHKTTVKYSCGEATMVYLLVTNSDNNFRAVCRVSVFTLSPLLSS